MNRPKGFVPTYYRYHKVAGHLTEKCDVLKKEIETPIRMGRWPSNRWRRPLPWIEQKGNQLEAIAATEHNDKEKGPAKEVNRGERNWQHKLVINVIFWGPEGGDTSGERKKWARQFYVGEIA